MKTIKVSEMKTPTIWKYPLQRGGIGEDGGFKPVEVKRGAEFLDVQLQGSVYTVWALVDEDEKETETWQFRVIGTGWRIECSLGAYVKTIQEGSFVWHIFRMKERG